MKKGNDTFLICLLWLLVAPWYTHGQSYNYQHYTVSDGLPSMVVYDILQDERGFIWLATKEGLTRFDGTAFRHFTTEHGLPSNEIIGIKSAKNGLLWVLPFRDKLVYLRNDSVGIANLAFEEEDPVKNIQTDPKGGLWVTHNSGKLVEHRNNIVQNIFEPTKFFDTEFTMFQGVADGWGNVWISTDTFLMKIDTNKCMQSWILKDNLNFVGSMKLPMVTTTNDVYVFTRKLVAKMEANRLKPVFSGADVGRDLSILNISQCRNGVLVSTSQGAYKINYTIAGGTSIEEFFTDQTISKTLEDTEGNLWFCTLNNGIYKISNNSRKIVNITASNGLFKESPGAFLMFKDTLVISSLYGNVYALVQVNGQWTAQKKAFGFYLENLNSCQPIEDEIWCASNYSVNIYRNGEKLSKSNWLGQHYIIETKDSTYDLDKRLDLLKIGTIKRMLYSNNTLWVAGSSTFKKITLFPGEANYKIKRIYNGRTTAIAFANDGKLWAALYMGLHSYQGDSAIMYKPIIPNTNITHILPYGPSGLWLSTAGRGLYRINGAADSLPVNYTIKDGLPSNVINHLLPTPFGIVLSTDKGLAMLVENKGKYELYPLSVNDGLIAPDVVQTILFKNHLFVLTSKGISIINESLLQADSSAPLVYITRANIAGNDTAILPSYILPYDKNNIRLEYVGLSYKSNGNILYRYQMEGVDTGWVETRFTNVQYPTLPPGSYTFKVDSRSMQGPWGGKPASMKITILPPFWQTWWFRILIGVLVLLIVTGIGYAIIRYYRNQSRIAQRMVELEGKALRANMNPHFVFNALNAIHDFIANQDERSAHLYLGKFAQLIRRILDQSRRNFISLEEELITLNLYLELENMRFEHKFDFKVYLGEGIQPYDLELPPMLIQPYLENAVRHGLVEMERQGNIEVRFEKQAKSLRCVIKDNGIGRTKAAEIASKRLKTHRSVGMEITQKRVELLNEGTSGNNNRGVIIIDLYDTTGQATGTQVELTLPLKEL